MLDYLSGRLTRREQHLFERELMSDPFEAEAMEGLSKLSAQELSDDLAQLEASLTYRQNRRLGTVLWRAAAIVLLMLIPASLLWLFVTQTSNNENGQIAQNKAVTEEPINDSIVETKPLNNS
jgi:ferric-dicitrate binding protein FerR (iron transport regulator)